MKLLDILLENTLEYKVEFVTIKDKDVSQGSALYKDLADAKKFFDSLTDDPEVYRAELKKVIGADSSRDVAGASFVGGTETIEYYNHPATKGVSQGGKRSDELTPAELDMRIFANSRLGTTAAKGFTSKDGTYKYLEEADLTKGETRKLKKMSKDLKKSSKGHASQAKYIDKLVREDTSLEEGVDDGMMQDIINNPNKRVYDLVDWFNQSEPMFAKDFDAFMYGRYEKFLNNKDVETKAKMYKVLQKMANK